MFKLVVLSALLALAVAEPSHILAPALHTSYLAPAVYAAPAAVSHQSRVDVHHSAPLVHAYAAPVHTYAAPVHAVAALDRHTPAVILGAHGVPLDTVDVVNARAYHYQTKALANHGLHYLHKRSLYSHPIAYSAVVAPSAVSHQSRVDVHHSSPVVHAYAAPVHAYAAPVHTYAAPVHTVAALDRHTPAVVLGAHGVPLDTVDVVNARAYHYQTKALANHGLHYLHKRSVYSHPIAYSAIVAPSTVSHQSVDVHHPSPLVHAYAAPVVSHYSAAPYASHYAPISTSTFWGKNVFGGHYLRK